MLFLIAGWLLIFAFIFSMRREQLEHIEAEYLKLGNRATAIQTASARGRWQLLSFTFLIAFLFQLGWAIIDAVT